MIDFERMMSGIAVVIDDAFNENSNNKCTDNIFQIVDVLEKKLKIPCYRVKEIPPTGIGDNLLKSASFILLDWTLWPKNAGQEYIDDKINENVNFLNRVREHFKPVFIFTNNDVSDVTGELKEPLYFENEPQKNFIFIKHKEEVLTDNNFESISNWIENNASVYVLKSWEQEFYESKKLLFASMYKKSPDWPKLFWKAYVEDEVDPSSSLTRLINDQLVSRMKSGIFDKIYINSESVNVPAQEIKSLIHESSFIVDDILAPDEIRAGDLFEGSPNEYLINIRPDCDCIPRNDGSIGDVELYCIVGKKMRNDAIRKAFDNGRFNEYVSHNICFCIYNEKTIKFDFKELKIIKYQEVKSNRLGRLIAPYTRKINLPLLEAVSIDSCRLFNWTPRDSSNATVSIRSRSDLLRRSSLHTTKVSPGRAKLSA